MVEKMEQCSARFCLYLKSEAVGRYFRRCGQLRKPLSITAVRLRAQNVALPSRHGPFFSGARI